MSEYTVAVRWERGEQAFVDNRYSRAHSWVFDGGVEVPASASPHIVPLPFSKEDAVDPEEAFVAALSSCHALWFLSIAAKKGFRVDRYFDSALGYMEKDSWGRLAITRVILQPGVKFSGDKLPRKEDVERMHHEAHEECFIANSVKTEVLCKPVYDEGKT